MSVTRQLADEVYEAMRSLAHGLPRASPAPDVYAVLGNLKLAGGSSLGDVLDVASAALRRSVDEFDVYDNAGDAGTNAELAAVLMREAAGLAREVGDRLERAQCAIGQQGYSLD